ncbi:MAG: 50S ribosomal protein L11 methyltransferase [Acidobacteriota bacterium]
MRPPAAGRPAAAGYFRRAAFSLPARSEEAAVSACWEAGCLGVQVAGWRPGARPRTVTLTAFFPPAERPASLSRRLAAALRPAGLRSGPRLTREPRRAWAEIFQRSLRPMPIGRHLLVVPQGCRPPARNRRRVVRVRFGQAFGTGEHRTTRLCLRLLQSALRPGDLAIDLGTGSGILAIAAAALGASRVLAVDRDPIALRVARGNLADNGASGRVILLEADAARACRRRGGRFDLAVANIDAATVGRILPDLSAALRPGGRAILSGFLTRDERGIAARARAAGLRLRSRLRSAPWSALLLARR